MPDPILMRSASSSARWQVMLGGFYAQTERGLERDDQFIGLPWIRREALQFHESGIEILLNNDILP